MSKPKEQIHTPAHEYVKAGWDAALRELQHQAAQLEARGAHRAAVTLYDAIRIVRAQGVDSPDVTST